MGEEIRMSHDIKYRVGNIIINDNGREHEENRYSMYHNKLTGEPTFICSGRELIKMKMVADALYWTEALL